MDSSCRCCLSTSSCSFHRLIYNQARGASQTCALNVQLPTVLLLNIHLQYVIAATGKKIASWSTLHLVSHLVHDVSAAIWKWGVHVSGINVPLSEEAENKSIILICCFKCFKCSKCLWFFYITQSPAWRRFCVFILKWLIQIHLHTSIQNTCQRPHTALDLLHCWGKEKPNSRHVSEELLKKLLHSVL